MPLSKLYTCRDATKPLSSIGRPLPHAQVLLSARIRPPTQRFSYPLIDRDNP